MAHRDPRVNPHEKIAIRQRLSQEDLRAAVGSFRTFDGGDHVGADIGSLVSIKSAQIGFRVTMLGTHTLTLTATDADANDGVDSVEIEVIP